MAATTMQPINELLPKLQTDYPEFSFVPADDFVWSSLEHTIHYNATTDTAALLLLHELGHALCGHKDFVFDIELLSQERAAWDVVRSKLAIKYAVTIDEGLIEDLLDTYRDWLDARSRCPSCHLTGLQTKTSTYVCANCRCSWRPNDARRCALRRYVTNT